MFGKLRKVTHKAGRIVWTQFEESGAIMTGTPVELDSDKTGDNYSPSPLVHETSWSESKTREVRAKGKVK